MKQVVETKKKIKGLVGATIGLLACKWCVVTKIGAALLGLTGFSSALLRGHGG